MQIFVLDEDPLSAATYLCDQHVPKLFLESVQLLSNVARQFGNDMVYKPAYLHHPCAKWLFESSNNVAWLILHATQIHNEYVKRFDKIHKSSTVFGEIIKMNFCGDPQQHTPFVRAINKDKYSVCHIENTVEAYKEYYRQKNEQWKITFKPMSWERGVPRPEWMSK